ncbi:MAG: hypothetical protein ABI851_07760 [Saprospiraceae bacterium]
MKKIYTILIAFLFIHSISFGQCFPDQHSTNWFDAWVSCQPAPSPNIASKDGHWIVYDLKERYSIDKIKLWNINDPAHLDWGIRDCKIEYSGNLVDWYDAGEFRLEKASGKSHYEGMDWMNVRMPEARYILISALSNYGKEDCYGFAEIKFSAEKNLISSNDNTNNDVTMKAVISPNPFQDYFMANISSNVGDEIHYSCVDLFGHVISSGKINMTQSNYILRVLTNEWATGNYQLILRKANQIAHYSIVKL